MVMHTMHTTESLQQKTRENVVTKSVRCLRDARFIGSDTPLRRHSITRTCTLGDETMYESHSFCKRRVDDRTGQGTAPLEVAEQVSVERTSWHHSLGFHGFINFTNALPEDEIKEFIDNVPPSCCQGIDSYHLVDDLLGKGNRKTAAAPFRKCRRRRKSSMRFLTTCFRENMRFSGRH